MKNVRKSIPHYIHSRRGATVVSAMNAIGQFFFDPTAGDDESAGRVQGPGFYIHAAVYVCSQNRRKKTLRIRCDHTKNYRSRLVRARAVLPRLPRSTANTADGGRGDDTLESENRPSRPITMRVILRVFRRSGRPIFDGGGGEERKSVVTTCDSSFITKTTNVWEVHDFFSRQQIPLWSEFSGDTRMHISWQIFGLKPQLTTVYAPNPGLVPGHLRSPRVHVADTNVRRLWSGIRDGTGVVVVVVFSSLADRLLPRLVPARHRLMAVGRRVKTPRPLRANKRTKTQ